MSRGPFGLKDWYTENFWTGLFMTIILVVALGSLLVLGTVFWGQDIWGYGMSAIVLVLIIVTMIEKGS